MKIPVSLLCLLLLPMLCAASQPRSVSGIYPHLATFNEEAECGTGAVVPWASRLWVVSYAPHKPLGSTDKLYEISPALEQIICPESIGGTPANRMIHRESGQLFIGPYVISAEGKVRVIPYSVMYGRHTGVARHLTDPANKVVFATMEEGFYEVDVHSLAVTELWADEQLKSGRKANLPGYHGKGFYSAQGRYIYANNGDHAPAALSDPKVPSGVLAEWDGKASAWTVVRRNQFTEVTGPGGIEGNTSTNDPAWSIGWDHRSLILLLLDHGKWSSFRLPKTSHCYDGAHGWNTEWPRIRDIGEDALLMTMHGSFWKFPKTFSSQNSAGIAPRTTYLKVVGDFCRWRERVVLGCDDTAQSEFLNKNPLKGQLAPPGKSQSNLWFVEPARLDNLGPALGRGAVWLDEPVKAGELSEPFLFSGFTHRSLHLVYEGQGENTITVDIDLKGNGQWKKLRELTLFPRQPAWVEFAPEEQGAWIRLSPARAATKLTAFFQYRGEDRRSPEPSALFDGLATVETERASGGLLHVRGKDFKTLRFIARNSSGDIACYDLDGELRLQRADDPAGAAWTSTNAAIPTSAVRVDDGSVLYVQRGKRWRLPKGDPAFDRAGPLGPERLCREVCTERNLLNVHGSFYELPAENAGGFAKLRPIATHNRRISDYASYRGMLVLTGISENAAGEHIVRSSDGKCALWVGVVDDLWQLGKPGGHGGPWTHSAVQAGQPSDAYLMTGYDHKRLTLSHAAQTQVKIRVEADVSGEGTWVLYKEFVVNPGEKVEHQFPDAFGAYWVRVVADHNTTATAKFVYD